LPALPARCASSRGKSLPVAASRSAAALTWVSRDDHQFSRLTSTSGSTLPVLFQLASGFRAGGRRASSASSSRASVARVTISCRSHPSMGSARARNCMNRQSSYGCHISRPGDPAAALTHWQGGLHQSRIGRGCAHHCVPRGALGGSDVPREDRCVAEWLGAEGVLYVSGAQAGPHERMRALGICESRHRSTSAGEPPLQCAQVGPPASDRG